MPYLKSEVIYASRFELAEKPNDIICRRAPVGVVNSDIAKQVITEVVELMAKDKKWSATQKKAEL